MSDGASSFLGVVTGLAAEARLIPEQNNRPGIRVAVRCAGANSRRAEEAAETFVAEGATALMSFGIAGALDPGRSAGDLIVANDIVVPTGERLPCDPAWQGDLRRSLQSGAFSTISGTIFGSAEPLLTLADKARAYAISGAQAVDMESHAVAQVAAEAGLPFLAVRTIADTAHDTLPAFVMSAVTEDGRPDALKAALTLLAQPRQMPAALRLARRSSTALSVLREVCRNAGPLFRGGG